MEASLKTMVLFVCLGLTASLVAAGSQPATPATPVSDADQAHSIVKRSEASRFNFCLESGGPKYCCTSYYYNGKDSYCYQAHSTPQHRSNCGKCCYIDKKNGKTKCVYSKEYKNYIRKVKSAADNRQSSGGGGDGVGAAVAGLAGLGLLKGLLFAPLLFGR